MELKEIVDYRVVVEMLAVLAVVEMEVLVVDQTVIMEVAVVLVMQVLCLSHGFLSKFLDCFN
jgi:hypothetical protein